MKTKPKDISLNVDALISRVEEFAAGTAPVKETHITIPQPIKAMSPKQIRATRASLGFSQTQFAALLNVPKVTAISWENGTRKPSGAALRLLAVAKSHPEALQTA
jgi:putative transcriptional regulator